MVKVKQKKHPRIIKKVMETKYCPDSQRTLIEAIRNHKGLKNTRWQHYKDLKGRTYVMFTADITDINSFFIVAKKNEKKNANNAIIETLFELIEYKKYMKLYYNSEDIFSYLHLKKEEMNKPDLLHFDHEKSNIRIYIKFLKINHKKYINVSSGYSTRLKVSNPDLGYFGGLFDDIDFGGKCIRRIYSGKPITLETAF